MVSIKLTYYPNISFVDLARVGKGKAEFESPAASSNFLRFAAYTGLGIGVGRVDAQKCHFPQENGTPHILGFLT
jgi:hypothetical protein